MNVPIKAKKIFSSVFNIERIPRAIAAVAFIGTPIAMTTGALLEREDPLEPSTPASSSAIAGYARQLDALKLEGDAYFKEYLLPYSKRTIPDKILDATRVRIEGKENILFDKITSDRRISEADLPSLLGKEMLIESHRDAARYNLINASAYINECRVTYSVTKDIGNCAVKMKEETASHNASMRMLAAVAASTGLSFLMIFGAAVGRRIPKEEEEEALKKRQAMLDDLKNILKPSNP